MGMIRDQQVLVLLSSLVTKQDSKTRSLLLRHEMSCWSDAPRGTFDLDLDLCRPRSPTLVCVSRNPGKCVSLNLLLRMTALGRDRLNSDFDFSISACICVFAWVAPATRALLWSDVLLVFKGETVYKAAPLNLRVMLPFGPRR